MYLDRVRIFLVRHGQSISNVDKSEHHRTADHAMPLSEEGGEQAKAAGIFLCKWFHEHKLYLTFGGSDTVSRFDARLWVSPYLRTRQTADNIEDEFRRMWFAPKMKPIPPGPWQTEPVFTHGRREEISLSEQQFGLFDGYEDDELAAKFPVEHAHYKKSEDFEGKFWAKMPQGESRFDVARRVKSVFGTFKRDEEKHKIQNLVVVAHGVTIRAFVMQWLHLPYEWSEKEPNPKNCSIRLIEDKTDRGYIFEGFQSPRS